MSENRYLWACLGIFIICMGIVTFYSVKNSKQTMKRREENSELEKEYWSLNKTIKEKNIEVLDRVLIGDLKLHYDGKARKCGCKDNKKVIKNKKK